MISVKSLHKRYGKLDVLKGIDCEIEASEVVCVIGPSGSGKSTFLRCLNLLEPITSGTVIINGHDLSNPKINTVLVRKDVGMVFQQFNLFPHMKVLENIMIAPIKVGKKSKAVTKEKALELLAKVGLSALSDRPTFANSSRAFSLVTALDFFPTLIGAIMMFSSTFMCGNKLNCWNTIPTSLRTMPCCDSRWRCRATSAPSKPSFSAIASAVAASARRAPMMRLMVSLSSTSSL